MWHVMCRDRSGGQSKSTKGTSLRKAAEERSWGKCEDAHKQRKEVCVVKVKNEPRSEEELGDAEKGDPCCKHLGTVKTPQRPEHGVKSSRCRESGKRQEKSPDQKEQEKKTPVVPDPRINSEAIRETQKAN